MADCKQRSFVGRFKWQSKQESHGRYVTEPLDSCSIGMQTFVTQKTNLNFLDHRLQTKHLCHCVKSCEVRHLGQISKSYDYSILQIYAYDFMILRFYTCDFTIFYATPTVQFYIFTILHLSTIFLQQFHKID